MVQLLYVGLHDGQIYSSASGAGVTLPKLWARQHRTYALRFLNLLNGVLVEEELHVRSLKATLGWADLPPTSGRFALKIGPGPESAGNTTAEQDWICDQGQMQAALNAVADKPAAFRVLKTGNSWMIGLVNGAAVTLEVVKNTLSPLSVGQIEGTQIDGAWWYELKLCQVPLALATNSVVELPPAPTITTIVDGYTDPSGVYRVNEVQRFKLPASFRSQWYFRYDSERTALLSREDNIERYKEVLDAILARHGGSVAVRLPETNMVDVEFQGELAGVNVDELEVVVPPEVTLPGDLTFTLDLGKWPMLAALRSVSELTEVPFEVTVEVVPHADDIANLDVPAKPLVLCNLPVTIGAPATRPALATTAILDWLRGPAPKSYTPSLPNQILTGQQQAYPTVVGDGEMTEFVIDHDLDSEVAYMVVRENFAGGRLLRPDEYTVAIESSNSLTLSFPDAPSLNEFYVFVVAIGPASVFQAHGHTIGQIEGLQDILDAYGVDIAALKAVLPSTGPGVSANTEARVLALLPPLSELLFLPEVDALSEKGGLDPAKLPERAPFLLPAVHQASVVTLPGTLPDPEATAGAVWENEADVAVLIDGGGGIRSSYVPAGGFVASDGRILYPVRRDGTTNSYYPAPFERTLWTLAVNEQQLAIGRTLTVDFSVLLQMARAARNADFFCQAQWVLVVEQGTAPQQTTPDPVGLNLQNIVWSGTPIIRQRIVLDPLFRAHRFGVRIRRQVGGLSLDRLIYDVWSGHNDSAPASANFVLRARMIQFDTENNQPLARGFVYLGLGSGITAEGGISSDPARAILT